ncbi:UNKNOWN [Stylonychia lemnae]|uniref:Uncharacterized protein n=1 Tax=Stylonychia lemnae TaxID=5949 RepID=A0A078A281_STYLE|nr:UNKNOWN [Stylonychia lemnae]|eukprot:CDW76316.1 UNKNOWN [Stylonychia lemnae]
MQTRRKTKDTNNDDSNYVPRQLNQKIGKVTDSNSKGATKDEILNDLQQIRGNASNISNDREQECKSEEKIFNGSAKQWNKVKKPMIKVNPSQRIGQQSLFDDESEEALTKLFDFVKHLHELDDDEILTQSEEKDTQMVDYPKNGNHHNFSNQDQMVSDRLSYNPNQKQSNFGNDGAFVGINQQNSASKEVSQLPQSTPSNQQKPQEYPDQNLLNILTGDYMQEQSYMQLIKQLIDSNDPLAQVYLQQLAQLEEVKSKKHLDQSMNPALAGQQLTPADLQLIQANIQQIQAQTGQQIDIQQYLALNGLFINEQGQIIQAAPSQLVSLKDEQQLQQLFLQQMQAKALGLNGPELDIQTLQIIEQLNQLSSQDPNTLKPEQKLQYQYLTEHLQLQLQQQAQLQAYPYGINPALQGFDPNYNMALLQQQLLQQAGMLPQHYPLGLDTLNRNAFQYNSLADVIECTQLTRPQKRGLTHSKIAYYIYNRSMIQQQLQQHQQQVAQAAQAAQLQPTLTQQDHQQLLQQAYQQYHSQMQLPLGMSQYINAATVGGLAGVGGIPFQESNIEQILQQQ